MEENVDKNTNLCCSFITKVLHSLFNRIIFTVEYKVLVIHGGDQPNIQNKLKLYIFTGLASLRLKI